MIHLILILMSFSLYAAPQNIEVWFLSVDKKKALNKTLDEKIKTSKKISNRLCERVGDLCFDPQFGLYNPDNEEDAVFLGKKIDNDVQIAPAGFDRDLINCDKANGFDIFCGKALPVVIPEKVEVEVWIDTSSSMREVDFTDEHGSCYRKSFITRVTDTCRLGKKIDVMSFDSSIKQIGTTDGLCINYGLNSTPRMIDWIERNESKHVILITDLNEYTKEFSDYLESKNAKIRGEKGDFAARALLEEVSSLVKMCK